jgi:hypothetical protein
VSLLQFCQDFCEGYSSGRKKYQQVIEQISSLFDSALTVLHGRHDDFYGFLAELLGNFGDTLLEQPGGVRTLRQVLPPLLNQSLQMP